MVHTSVVSRLTQDLNTVLSVSRAMTAERNLDALLDLIVDAATSLVHADRTSLFIVEGDQLWTRIAQGRDAITLPIGRGIAGTVADTGEIINIPDAYADDRFNPEYDKASGYTTRSILCMPLLSYSGGIVGVVQTLNKDSGKPFEHYDEELLGALCSQAAVAIEKTQLISKDRERQQLLRDMELARCIQLGLIPAQPPEQSGWRYAAWQDSCDQTSGDYYDFIENDSHVCDTIVGDVSGHGIGAALIMSTARAFLRGLYRNNDQLDGIMADLNDLLEADMADDIFMTMCITRLLSDGHWCYVSAGHEAPTLVRKDGHIEDVEVDTGIMLGVMPGMPYPCVSGPQLDVGDKIVMFTDGLFEAFNADGKELGVEALNAFLSKHSGLQADVYAQRIREYIYEHLGDEPAQDDLTCVVMERCV
jgi:phosphoserine phosphatase RsbU/P